MYILSNNYVIRIFFLHKTQVLYFEKRVCIVLLTYFILRMYISGVASIFFGGGLMSHADFYKRGSKREVT